MRKVGDGLQAQMSSMMGALQELKLLQVQTALEQLEISGKTSQAASPAAPCPVPLSCPPSHEQAPSRSRRVHGRSLHPSAASSPESGSFPLPQRTLRDGALCREAGPEARLPLQAAEPLDLTAVLQMLSRDGPSLHSDRSRDSADDGSDWTSSLMSRSRNRRPLVLGDNVFADLVGNWLDLPELEERPAEAGERAKVAGQPSHHPLRLSRSQEICRKVSLTANIFRRFLHSVRPDKDKLLAEKPGWMPPEDPETQLCKRPKKAIKPKGSFYLPFRAGAGGQGRRGKGSPCPVPAENEAQISGVCTGSVGPEFVENAGPVFDFNSAVWV